MKIVRNIHEHVGAGEKDDKEENCWKYMMPKALVERACEIAMNGSCPDCGKSGRKDDNCTHINDCPGTKSGKRCNASWCYLCGLKAEDCDKLGEYMMGHNEEWQPNLKRCPLYIQELHIVDRKFEDDATQAGNEFHRQRTLHYLQHVLNSLKGNVVVGLTSQFPAVLQGFTINEIRAFRLSPSLKRGNWWKPDSMDMVLNIKRSESSWTWYSAVGSWFGY